MQKHFVQGYVFASSSSFPFYAFSAPCRPRDASASCASSHPSPRSRWYLSRDEELPHSPFVSSSSSSFSLEVS